MHKVLQAVTDRVTTKKGVWITLAVWLIAVVLLALFAPGAKDYEVSQVDSLPGKPNRSLPKRNWISTFVRTEHPPFLFFSQNKGN